MSDVTNEQLAALADKLTDPNYPLLASTQGGTGAAAAAQGRALLVQEYGLDEALDTVLRQAGRSHSDLVREAVHNLLTEPKLVS